VFCGIHSLGDLSSSPCIDLRVMALFVDVRWPFGGKACFFIGESPISLLLLLFVLRGGCFVG